jgi:acetyltransferase-like isoleucine patch superfamily enzyme
MENASIGYLNQIIAHTLILKEKSKIDRRNRIKNLNLVSLDFNALIRSENFIGAPIKGTIDKAIKFENQNLYIGRDSAILRDHYFDVVEEVIIGNNVIFGGGRSEVWSHGFDLNRNMLVGKIIFGNNIFIGSNCVFTKGISICNDVTIAPGSVIYKSINEKGIYSTHEIRKIK